MNAWLSLGAGLVALYFGAEWLIKGGAALALRLGLTPLVIGLTVVAFGTSLPELAASLVAAIRKDGDIAIGNVVGSNIFNLLGILGVAGLVKPIDAPGLQWSDLGVLTLVSVAMLPVAWTGGRISRLEGAALLTVYVGYTAWLLY